MDLGLIGKKAIVTGASRGIGFVIAQTLASEGVDLAICARGADGLETAVKDLQSRGRKVFSRAFDVEDGDTLRAFVEESAEQLGGLDILVSNPSGGNAGGEESWKSNFEVDLMGCVRSFEAATPSLLKSDSASVIFISSTAAVETFMGPTSYNALKGAVVIHANGLSQTFGPQGIRVNTISPGPVYFEGGSWQMIEKNMPDMFKEALKGCATGRMSTAEDVANAAVFLASPTGGNITGVNLIVDGGFTKRVNF